MNTTEAIRRYVKDHPEEIVDAAFLHKTLFPIIKKQTYLKLFSRLAEEGTIKSVGRGVYAPASLPDEKVDEAILDYYANHGNGMLYGDALYFALGLASCPAETTMIYTNRLENGKKKHVSSYELIGADIVFDDEAKDLITLLELIEDHAYAISLDSKKYAEIYNKLSRQDYSYELFEEIIKSIKYKDSTITILKNMA
ncbi:hypothetical protein IKL45_00180 [Candidatus Saccharibacteria bacterium]|nr:hypothetical protein [Candidatus Saccharibacteria bacterium]MBR6122525.1 hypothetical protein [Candidatus Saccharibacteria bacterium]